MIENIEYNREKIHTWKFIEKKIKFEDCRIYYKPSEMKENGFHFYCVKCVAWDSNDKPDGWVCVFKGIARFDGIRHFYLGDDQTFNDGYIYYPNLNLMQFFLTELKKLEKRFCDKTQLPEV
jgi:hypothetical protein